MVKWESLRTDIRSFARLADYSIDTGAPAALVRRLEQGAANVSAAVPAEMLALVLCWRVACWPRSTNLIVTPSSAVTKRLIRIAYKLMGDADDELRERIHFLPRGEGFSCEGSDVIGAVHCSTGTLGLTLPATNEPLTFMLPDFGLVPGCHSKYIPRLLSRPGTTVICNHARRGKVL